MDVRYRSSESRLSYICAGEEKGRMFRSGREYRPSSRPFVSGDTFRELARVVVEGLIWRENPLCQSEVLFAKPDIVQSKAFMIAVEIFVRRNAWEKPKLVIHNGDLLPHLAVFQRLSGIFSNIFAVNVVEDDFPATAIPIGLENAWHRKNGAVSLFQEGNESNRVGLESKRLIGASFREETNPRFRAPLKKLFEAAGHVFQPPKLSPTDYTKWLKSHMFILSPPGNGNDCHRTWEALYLGAIPIVLKTHLSQSLIDHSAIWGVDSFEEVLDFSGPELIAKYEQLIRKRSDVAYIKHWENELIT